MSRDTAPAADAIVDAASKVAAEQPSFMMRYVLFFQKDTPNSNGINTLNAGIHPKRHAGVSHVKNFCGTY